MQVTRVKFAKPWIPLPDYLKHDGISTGYNVWEYTIKEADFDFHGMAGGWVRRMPITGFWQAKYYEHTEWAAPAKTREGAIDNVLEAAQIALKESRHAAAALDKAREDRFAHADSLRKLFPDGWCVSDEGAWQGQPVRYRVSIDNLSEEQVREVAVLIALYSAVR